MPRKPLAEVLTVLYVNERYRLNPESQTPWENMSDRARAAELGAMVEVVRTFDGFGLELANVNDQVVLRPIAPPEPPPQRTPRVVHLANGATLGIAAPTRRDAPVPTIIKDVQHARMAGFEGEPCPSCGAWMLVRNGTCMKCMSCGETTGCS